MTTRRVCVITGGTQGVGRAVAELLADSGDVLLLAYRANEEAARDAVAELSAAGALVEAVRCDVSDADQVRALFTRADELGEVTGLVNSAGFAEHPSDFEQIDADRWTRVLATNVVGTASCCREAVTRMKRSETESRAIVNLSSRAAELGSPGEWVDYAASKAAVDTLTRGLALELSRTGIRVNSVQPGLIDTDFHASAGAPGRAERMAPDQPMGRSASAMEVARAVVWLLSAQASYTTGSVLQVSGGR